MANFEAFLQSIKLSANLLFLKSDFIQYIPCSCSLEGGTGTITQIKRVISYLKSLRGPSIFIQHPSKLLRIIKYYFSTRKQVPYICISIQEYNSLYCQFHVILYLLKILVKYLMSYHPEQVTSCACYFSISRSSCLISIMIYFFQISR